MATALTPVTQDFILKCTAMASAMVRLPSPHMWLDYDEEADVLYISFRKPQHATKTIELDDDILVRKDGKTVVGVTILNASQRK